MIQENEQEIREREIAELEADIAWAKKQKSCVTVKNELETAREAYAPARRIIARLAALLEEKCKGFRRESEAKETQA